jgi:hypothetical protein
MPTPWYYDVTVRGEFFDQDNWKEMLRALVDDAAEKDGLRIIGNLEMQYPFTPRASGNQIRMFGIAEKRVNDE